MARDLHHIPRDDTEEPPEPPRLRSLRRLVTLLTATMILAMLVIAAAVVWQVMKPSSGEMLGDMPVPPGLELRSVSQAGGDLILLLRDPETGAQSVRVLDAATRQPKGRYRLIKDKPE